MSIRKVSDLAGLDVNTADRTMLDQSLIEVSYLLSSDDYNHRWYQSMALPYQGLVQSIVSAVSEYGGSTSVLEHGLQLSGNMDCNAEDTWNEITATAGHNYTSRLKFKKFGLSCGSAEIVTPKSYIRLREDGSVDISAQGSINLYGSGININGKSLQSYVADVIAGSGGATLIRTES